MVEDWLKEPRNGPWLMIVDNVDDVDVIFSRTTGDGSSKDKLQLLSCIPEVSHGSVVFTKWKHVAKNITKRDHVHICEMTEEQGVKLIKSHLGGDYDSSPDITALLGELGHIPLAITHAAAFMSENTIGVSEYLETYRHNEDDRSTILAPTMESMGVLDSNEAYSAEEFPVREAWLISFNHVKTDEKAGPLAIDLLSIMSFLDCQDIPKYLLDDFRPGTIPAEYLKAFGTLKSFSMVSQTGTTNPRFKMHRIIQLEMRRWLDNNDLGPKYAREALEIVSKKFPESMFANWSICNDLSIHAESVLCAGRKRWQHPRRRTDGDRRGGVERGVGWTAIGTSESSGRGGTSPEGDGHERHRCRHGGPAG